MTSRMWIGTRAAWACLLVAACGLAGCNESSGSDGSDAGDGGANEDGGDGLDGSTVEDSGAEAGEDAGDEDAEVDGNSGDSGADADAAMDAEAGPPGFDQPGIDAPRPSNPCLPPGDGQMWTLLSDTPCFERDDDDVLVPIDTLIPFDINSALWSDFADKQRLLSLPDGATLGVEDDGDLVFPEGTMFIKTFSLEGRRLETRFLVHHPATTDGDGGVVSAAFWKGYAYRWADDDSDATLITEANWEDPEDGVIIPLTPPVNNLSQWRIPWTPDSHTDPAVPPGARVDDMCMRCHTQAAGFALGPELRQLNRLYTYEGTGRTANQVYTWEALGLFEDPLPEDPEEWPYLAPYQDLDNDLDRALNPDIPAEVSWEEAARSYLHSNCSYCHRPGGGGLTEQFQVTLPFADMVLCNQDALRNGNNPELPDKLFVPGDHAASAMYWRLVDITPYGEATSGAQGYGGLPSFEGDAGTPRYRMPYMASDLVDSLGETIIRNWINETPSCP